MSPRVTYTVAVYDVALTYGAYAFARRANRHLSRLDRLNGRYPKHSVLSDGALEALVMEGAVPEGFPARKPHYE